MALCWSTGQEDGALCRSLTALQSSQWTSHAIQHNKQPTSQALWAYVLNNNSLIFDNVLIFGTESLHFWAAPLYKSKESVPVWFCQMFCVRLAGPHGLWAWRTRENCKSGRLSFTLQSPLRVHLFKILTNLVTLLANSKTVTLCVRVWSHLAF